MTKEEEYFHEIANKLKGVTKGKVFGTVGIKVASGKVAAIFWKDEIMIKLNLEDEKEALKLSNSRPGSHLYAPDKKMKNWVTVSFIHASKWGELITKSILNLNEQTK